MPDQPLLSLLGPPLRRTILQYYTPDSCVASSAIGLKVLDAIGMQARPISVKVLIANPAWTRRSRTEGHPPRSVRERERWWIESGAHAVGAGVPDPTDTETPPLVNGLHVVLLVENTWLWDLSIDQAARPDKDILITRPFVGDLGPSNGRWFKGQEMLSWGNPGGLTLAYTLKPKDVRWEQHPNWIPDGRDAGTRQQIADEAMRALKGLAQTLR